MHKATQQTIQLFLSNSHEKEEEKFRGVFIDRIGHERTRSKAPIWQQCCDNITLLVSFAPLERKRWKSLVGDRNLRLKICNLDKRLNRDRLWAVLLTNYYVILNQRMFKFCDLSNFERNVKILFKSTSGDIIFCNNNKINLLELLLFYWNAASPWWFV